MVWVTMVSVSVKFRAVKVSVMSHDCGCENAVNISHTVCHLCLPKLPTTEINFVICAIITAL